MRHLHKHLNFEMEFTFTLTLVYMMLAGEFISLLQKVAESLIRI